MIAFHGIVIGLLRHWETHSLPVHRAWLGLIPFLVLAAWIAADRILGVLAGRGRRAAPVIALAVGGLFVVNGLGHLRFDAFREWPDNAVVPDVLREVRRTHAASSIHATTSLGFPWHQPACFAHYRRRWRLGWLMLPARTIAEEPRWDHMLLNSRRDRSCYPDHRVVRSYPRFQVWHLQRVTSARRARPRR